MSNMVVNTNVLALNSHRALKNVGNMQSKASARLSSGLRINSAADDAAGLAISEKMRAQIKGLDQASRNSQDGISLIQTAEGGLSEIGNMVTRVRELIVQAANDTNVHSDRMKLQDELNQLAEEIDDMAGRVEFNTKILLDGNTTDVTFQVGANANQTMNIKLDEFDVELNVLDAVRIVKFASTLALGTNVNYTATQISNNLSSIDAALDEVNSFRAALGAKQNRLEYTIKSLDITSENLSASESRIRDTDMAKEMMNVTKANVLQQAATSMLSQANQAPQNVLQLLN